MKDDGVYLQHIRDAIHQIRSYTQEGKEPFLADRKSQDATVRNLEIIGEAVKKLSPRLRSTRPDVPWKRIARGSRPLRGTRARWPGFYSRSARGGRADPTGRTRTEGIEDLLVCLGLL